jgi:zinc transporter
MSQDSDTTLGTDDGDGCVVLALELDGSGSASPCDDEASTTGPQWLHIDFSSHQAQEWLLARGLHRLVVETLTRDESRPRTIKTERGLLVMLRGINMNPGADPEDMVSLRMWLEPNRLITVRQRRLLAIQEVRQSLDAGTGPVNVPDLVVQIIEHLTDRIVTFVDQSEDVLLNYEEKVGSSKVRTIGSELSALRREIAVVRRFVAPLREALEGLARQQSEVFDSKWSYAIRDQADRITRTVEDLDLVRERLNVVQEDVRNRLSQEQNDRLYVFSIVAAVFLPITFISGLFGMNTAGLPGVEDPLAFWLVILFMLAVTAATIAYLRTKKWF